MLIQERKLATQLGKDRQSQFFIERFLVPEGLMAIKLVLESEVDQFECVFIYDSDYNLRMELDKLTNRAQIIIHEHDKPNSYVKPGPIIMGEWILAFEVTKGAQDQSGHICYRLEGKTKL